MGENPALGSWIRVYSDVVVGAAGDADAVGLLVGVGVVVDGVVGAELGVEAEPTVPG